MATAKSANWTLGNSNPQTKNMTFQTLLLLASPTCNCAFTLSLLSRRHLYYNRYIRRLISNKRHRVFYRAGASFPAPGLFNQYFLSVSWCCRLRLSRGSPGGRRRRYISTLPSAGSRFSHMELGQRGVVV